MWSEYIVYLELTTNIDFRVLQDSVMIWTHRLQCGQWTEYVPDSDLVQHRPQSSGLSEGLHLYK